MNKSTGHKAESNSIIKQCFNVGFVTAIISLLSFAFYFGLTVQESRDNVKLIDYKIKLSKYENDSIYKK